MDEHIHRNADPVDMTKRADRDLYGMKGLVNFFA